MDRLKEAAIEVAAPLLEDEDEDELDDVLEDVAPDEEELDEDELDEDEVLPDDELLDDELLAPDELPVAAEDVASLEVPDPPHAASAANTVHGAKRRSLRISIFSLSYSRIINLQGYLTPVSD